MKLFPLVLALSMSVAAGARAQQPPATCPEKPIDEASARALAGTWFEKGDELVAEEQFGEAVGAFMCSVRMIEHPATFFNAAKAAELAGDSEQAIQLLKRLLDLDPEGETSDDARALLEEIEAGQSETVEDTTAEPEPSASAAGEPAAADGSSTSEVDDHAEAQGAEADSPPKEGGSGLKTGGYVLIGAGAAGLVVGGILQGMAGAARKTTGETSSYTEYAEAKDDIKSFQTGAVVGFVAGGVLLGTGLVLVAVGGGHEDDAEVALVPAPGGLALAGRF